LEYLAVSLPLRGLAAGALLLAISATPAAAQGGSPATLTGSVRSQAGLPISGATIGFGALSATSNGEGRFRLEVPAASAGILVVRAVGFAPDSLRLAALDQGRTRSVALTLVPLAVLDPLTVVAVQERPLINTQDAATGGALEQQEIEQLPTDARNPLNLLFTLPGVSQATGFFGDAPVLSFNGQNGLYTQYLIDGLDNNEGFLGGPRVEFPLAGLAGLSALVNTYSTEFGRSSNGVVDYQTRAGGDAWHGEMFAFYRPGTPFDARPKFLADSLDAKGFRRIQLGGALGGPIVPGKTLAFGTIEYTDETEDRNPSTAQAQFVGQEQRTTWRAFGRLDQGWSPTQITTLRFALSDVTRAGTGGGVVTPEAETTTRRVGSISSITHRSAFQGGRASNDLSLQLGTFHWYFPPSRSSFDAPQVTIVSPDLTTVEAVVGSSNFVFDEKELQLQLRDVLEMPLGNRHTLRAGADVLRSSFTLTGSSTNPLGAYVVVNEGNITPAGATLSITDIPDDVRVLSYTVDARQQQVDLSQTLVGAFIEDRFRITPSLLVQAGLRWDYDDITSRGESSPDLNNFQPRASFNWHADPSSVIRGGAGLYTGKLPYAVYSDAVQFGPEGNAVVTFTEGDATPPPAFGQAPPRDQLLAQIGSFPPREIRRTFALGLEQPSSAQFTLGFQRQLGRDWAIAIDGVYADTRNLPRSWDLNAITRSITPADSVNQPTSFGDPSRPVTPENGSFRRLTTTESGGQATFWGLYTTVRRRFADNLITELAWTWSRARNNTEDINFTATGANNDFEAEWADAVNDRRHHVTLRGIYTIAGALRLSGIADFQTGTPINRVAFFRDLDGSGSNFGVGFVGNSDRFFGVERNDERLPSTFALALGAAWLVPVASGNLEVRMDVFNVFNSTNESGFANGIPGGGPRTQVGRPGDAITYTQAGPARQVQLSGRYVF
jgi:hypothetical protein